MIRVVVILVLAGCSINDVDFTGKACPCPSGYVCDAATQTCARSATPGEDAAVDTPTDTSTASCLVNPFTNQVYTTDFADLSTQWEVGGGSWVMGTGEVLQEDADSPLSFIHHGSNASDYRVVTRMRATSGGAGRAIEIALRINAAESNMYHCNWEPIGGAFIIQRTDSINTGDTLQELDIDTDQIVGYSPTATFVMEFQVIGSSFECCMRGIQGASLTGSDVNYEMGNVGVKTYLMSGGFSNFEVYVQ